MPALALTVAQPARTVDRGSSRALRVVERVLLEHRAVLELATADDLSAGMTSVAALVRGVTGAARVEWWAAGEDGEAALVAADGRGIGVRHELELGRAGFFALFGGHREARLAASLAPLEPIVRRRAAEERLARTTVELARRNEALEDFAALVAHELKAPLHAALAAADPFAHVEQALGVVEALLESAHAGAAQPSFASAGEALEQAASDLGAEGVEITADLPATLPLPPEPLRVILRNLLANAVAAGAHSIRVTTEASAGSCRLHVDDDGAGLGESYAAGSGLGLGLCRRIAGRLGGAIELAPRAAGGTRATLVLGAAAA
jgi:signal transduction histidine kinase